MAEPGDLIYLEIKKLGKIKGVGHRISGDKRRRARGIDWEFAHVCVDDASRLADVEVLADEKGKTAAGFLDRDAPSFTDLGIGSTVFAQILWQLHLRHTRPYTPRTNGKAERLLQILARVGLRRALFKLEYARTFATP